MAGALDNLRVLDLSRVLAGPFATMMLADLGAEVTKVERPGSGDDTRGWGPPYDAGGEATYFLAVEPQQAQRRPRPQAIPADLAEVRRLALAADVVVENFRPGFIDGIGLGYDELRRARTRGSSTARSAGSAAAPAPSCPATTCSCRRSGGLMSITGEPDGEPQKVGVALVDVLAGLFATVGILAALRHRDASGAGAAGRHRAALLAARRARQPGPRRSPPAGSSRRGWATCTRASLPTRCCAARDGHLVIAVGNDRQFAAPLRDRRRPRARRRRALRDQPGAGRQPRSRAAGPSSRPASRSATPTSGRSC